MKLEFKATQKFSAIKSEFDNLKETEYYRIEKADPRRGGTATHRICDLYFDAWAFVTVGDDFISITTSWSQFDYEITKGQGDEAYITYEGAFNGFLQQQLLPEITVDKDYQIWVKSTLNPQELSLLTYLSAREQEGLCGLDEDGKEWGLPRPFWGLLKGGALEGKEELVLKYSTED